ncbi:MAG: polysaccharide deacetylase family protein [Armatimonadetes bacterium]|nr:polysaccharide deacetylase family protein [Armatimonadota bacterium]
MPWLVGAVLLAGCTRPVHSPPAVSRPDVPRKEPRRAAPTLPDVTPDLKGRTIVLTYHDFVPHRNASSLWFDCTPDEFRDQLDWLEGQGAVFVTVDDLYRHLTEARTIDKNAVLLTFADNYLGFYRFALPELRKRKIPAVMFVHTGFVGGRTGRPKMDWRQLQELSDEGLVVVASQTVTHPADLSKLDDAGLKRELTASKAQLETKLGGTSRYLAYPNGKFDERCAHAARSAGYAMAFTEEQRPSETAKSVWTVPRYVHTKWKAAWEDKWAPNRPSSSR